MTEPFDRSGLPAAQPDPTSPYPTLPPPVGERADLAVDPELDGDGEPPQSDDTPTVSKRARRARGLLDWIVVVGIALLVAFLVRTFVLAHFVVDGESMMTTLHNGDRVFVNKLSYRLHDPRRGDVVVLHEIQNGPGSGSQNRDLIKRVIGLPGEEIAMRDCIVTIDGVPLDEPYLDEEEVAPGNCGPPIEPQVVPEGTVFVMGDNRDESQDSRALGPIDEDDLVGRAFVVFWPTSHWRWL